MPNSFNYIPEGGMTLSTSQKSLLLKIERLQYGLKDFSNIAEVRKNKAYLVVVTDRGSFADTVKKEIEALGDYANDLYGGVLKDGDPEQLRILARNEIIEEKKNKLYGLLGRLGESSGFYNNNVSYPLLGLYCSHGFSYGSPVIYLFKENIDEYADTAGVSSDSVFGFVYAHEAMHAYYDSKNNRGFEPVKELEEAFAECGMLEILERNASDLDIYHVAMAAVDCVNRKQYYGPYDYGFGMALQDLTSKTGKVGKWMERYREVSNWLGAARSSMRSGDVMQYVLDVLALQRTCVVDSSYDAQAQVCCELVERIIFKGYVEPHPDVTSFPGLGPYMRNHGVIPRVSRRARRASPKPVALRGSRLYCTGSLPEEEVPLLEAESASMMAWGVVSAMAANALYPGDFLNMFRRSGAAYLNETGYSDRWVRYMPFPISVGGVDHYLEDGWVVFQPDTHLNLVFLVDQCLTLATNRPLHLLVMSGGGCVLYGDSSLVPYFSVVAMPSGAASRR